MSDHLLAPLTALGRTTPVIETIGEIKIAENPGLAIASVAARNGREAGLKKALATITEELPGPGRAVLAGSINAVWMGVSHWFLIAPFDPHADFAWEVKDIVKDAASVAEQTDGWAVFDIAGDNLFPLLERLCNLNSKAMSEGDATRTVIEHLGCLIICRKFATNYRIFGPRSSAASLHHALVAAARSVA